MEMDVYPGGWSQGPVNLVLAHFFIFLLQGLQCREYCNVDTFQADCGDHQVVLMTSARYGRMHIGKCIQQDLGHVGCHVDVLAQLDAQCSGRKHCTIANLDAALRNVNPCSELVKYLDAAYKCIPVMSVSSYQCQTSHAIFAPPPPSHLANIVTKETDCGGQGHPWVIEVDMTKRINITLIDFGMMDIQDDSECIQYGVIQEPGRPGATRICGKMSRIRAIYLSKGHRVEIILKSPDEIGQAHFLVEYEAVGCPTPVSDDNMWLRQENGHVTVGCQGDPSIRWQVTCIGDTWIGHIGNCTKTTGGSSGDDVMTTFLKSMPRDLLIYITAGLCVLLLLLLVIVVMVCTRRFCPSDDRPDVYELAVRRGNQPLVMRAPQQQTPQPQHTTLTADNVGQGSPAMLHQQMDDPWAVQTTLPTQPKRTPPKPTPRRTLARRQQEGQSGVEGPASPTLPSPGSSRDRIRHIQDTNQKSPQRHSSRRRPAQGSPNETGGATAKKGNKPTSYTRNPNATSRSRGRPEPSAPAVEDMGFV